MVVTLKSDKNKKEKNPYGDPIHVFFKWGGDVLRSYRFSKQKPSICEIAYFHLLVWCVLEIPQTIQTFTLLVANQNLMINPSFEDITNFDERTQENEVGSD